jgi:hypothetical protein
MNMKNLPECVQQTPGAVEQVPRHLQARPALSYHSRHHSLVVLHINKKSRTWNEITSAITYHIAKDMEPIQTVEKDGFRKLIRTLDPRYDIPSRKYRKLCRPELYTECRDRVANEIRNAAFFSTTSVKSDHRAIH